MFGLRVPIISVVIGEGGSGGALAIGCANYNLIMEHSVYYVASPEACAAILWKSRSKVSAVRWPRRAARCARWLAHVRPGARLAAARCQAALGSPPARGSSESRQAVWRSPAGARRRPLGASPAPRHPWCSRAAPGVFDFSTAAPSMCNRQALKSTTALQKRQSAQGLCGACKGTRRRSGAVTGFAGQRAGAAQEQACDHASRQRSRAPKRRCSARAGLPLD